VDAVAAEDAARRSQRRTGGGVKIGGEKGFKSDRIGLVSDHREHCALTMTDFLHFFQKNVEQCCSSQSFHCL